MEINPLSSSMDVSHVKSSKWWMSTLWIPFCWVAIQNSQGFSFLLGCLTGSPIPLIDENAQSTSTAVMEKPVDAIVLIALLFLAVIVLVKRREKVVCFIKKNIWLMGLILFAGISCTWSDFPSISFRKYIRFFGTFAVACMVFTENDPCRYALRLVELVIVFFVLGSLACVFVYPDIGKQVWPDGKTYWYGITSHKNLLGQYSAIGFIFFCWRLWFPSMLKLKLVYFLLAGISVVVLFCSRSFSSLGLALAAFAFFMVLVISKKFGQMGGFLAVVGIATIICGTMFLSNMMLTKPLTAYILEAGDKDATLSGRTDIWELALEEITPQMKVVGAGFDSFWMSKQGDAIRRKLDWNATHAHNGYLNVFLQFGSIGVVLLFLFLFSLVVRIFRLHSQNYKVFALFLVVITISLVSNMDESNFAVSSDLYWLLLLVVNSASFEVLPDYTADSEILVAQYYDVANVHL